MVVQFAAAAIAAQLKLAELQASLAEMDALRETVELQRAEIAELSAREPETVYVEVPVERVVERPAESVECGACGAHVTEWWYVRDMADTGFVEVCHDCKAAYEAAL